MASVTKRRWTKPDGSTAEAWAVRWRDGGGAYRQKTFERKKDADKYRAYVAVEFYDGKGVCVAASYTIKDLCQAFLKSSHAMVREGKLAKTTEAKESFYFIRYIIPALGTIALRDFSETHVDHWLRDLKGLRPGRSMDLQPATIKQLTQALGRALDYAHRRKMVASNVARDVGKWREHRLGKNPPIRTFKVEEAKRLLASVAHQDHGLTVKRKQAVARPGWTRRSEAFVRCATYLAAFCGLRLGEVLGLTWEHVDFEGGLIRVRHSLDLFDDLKLPKTKAGVRDVPMPALLAAELKAWRTHAASEARGLLFRTKPGGKITTANFHKHYWQPALEDAGLGPDAGGRRFHYHALRHFAASMMIAGGVPLPDVAQLLGHSSFDMTLQVYAHPVAPMGQKAIALENIATTLHIAEMTQTHSGTYLLENA